MVAFGADRRRCLLDGDLPRKLHPSDPQRRRTVVGPAGAGCAGGRLPHPSGTDEDGKYGPWSNALTGRFAPLLPELILSIGATVLMMAAAFSGRRASGAIAWVSIALLIAATFALIGAPSHAGPVFDGIVTADLFGAFGKAIIFPAAAVAIIA